MNDHAITLGQAKRMQYALRHGDARLRAESIPIGPGMVPPAPERVYLAGPMRGYPYFNFPAFHEQARLLRAAGYEVVSPAEMDEEAGLSIEHYEDPERPLPEGFDIKARLVEDIRVISTVDVIALLPGWEASTGAQAEKAFAEATGVDVRYITEDGLSTEPPEIGLEEFVAAESVRDPAFAAALAKVGEESTFEDPDTGAKKGVKLARFDLLPAGPLLELALHYGRGASKYEDHNWRKGYPWSVSFAALMRHLWAFWGGEDIDAETGTPHIVAVAWHALALTELRHTHPEKDDRWAGPA